MADEEQGSLSERVVKEAVEIGMESPMRDSILEAVEESGGSPGGRRDLPLLGAILGLGVGVGYLLGARQEGGVDLDELPIDEFDAPKLVEGAKEAAESEAETDEESTDEGIEIDTDEDGGGSRLGRIVLALGIVGAVVFLRRRLQSEAEEDEWEPIEEFEPAAESESGDEGEEPGAKAESEETTEDVDGNETAAEEE